MTAENDSQDLEAIFDFVAASTSKKAQAAAAAASAPPPPSPPASPPASDDKTGDSGDLQALFDTISAEHSPVAQASAPQAPVQNDAAPQDSEWTAQDSVFNRLGQMVRQLHNTLHELGYDKLLEKTVNTTIPDAKDRLAYVATLTEQAASRVLNATDIAKPLVDSLAVDSKALAARWDAVFTNQMSTAEFKKLAEDTRSHLKTGFPTKVEQVDAQLLEIMMAQDFQDLTGQVIKKIVALAQELEDGLVKALLEVVPESKRSEEVTKATGSFLNGPVIDPTGRTDVVTNQQQVDDLLESLGF